LRCKDDKPDILCSEMFVPNILVLLSKIDIDFQLEISFGRCRPCPACVHRLLAEPLQIHCKIIKTEKRKQCTHCPRTVSSTDKHSAQQNSLND